MENKNCHRCFLNRLGPMRPLALGFQSCTWNGNTILKNCSPQSSDGANCTYWPSKIRCSRHPFSGPLQSKIPRFSSFKWSPHLSTTWPRDPPPSLRIRMARQQPPQLRSGHVRNCQNGVSGGMTRRIEFLQVSTCLS